MTLAEGRTRDYTPHAAGEDDGDDSDDSEEDDDFNSRMLLLD